MDSDLHPIDQWQHDAEASQTRFAEHREKEAQLVFHTFNTDAGKELLKKWKDQLMYESTANPGDDEITIGMREGYKNFIRSIIHSIDTYEVK